MITSTPRWMPTTPRWAGASDYQPRRNCWWGTTIAGRPTKWCVLTNWPESRDGLWMIVELAVDGFFLKISDSQIWNWKGPLKKRIQLLRSISPSTFLWIKTGWFLGTAVYLFKSNPPHKQFTRTFDQIEAHGKLNTEGWWYNKVPRLDSSFGAKKLHF